MNIAKTGVVEGHSGEKGGVGHAFAGFDITTIGYGSGKVFANEFDGLHGKGIGSGVGVNGDVAFNGVGQGVHACRGGGAPGACLP